MKVYIVCVHIGGITRINEVYMDENKALERLYALREANTLRDVAYSLQYAPLVDGEG